MSKDQGVRSKEYGEYSFKQLMHYYEFFRLNKLVATSKLKEVRARGEVLYGIYIRRVI